MNDIEEFLNSRQGVYYSVKTLAKKFNLSKRKAYNTCSSSPLIKKLRNHEIVGSGKSRLNIFYF